MFCAIQDITTDKYGVCAAFPGTFLLTITAKSIINKRINAMYLFDRFVARMIEYSDSVKSSFVIAIKNHIITNVIEEQKWYKHITFNKIASQISNQNQ